MSSGSKSRLLVNRGRAAILWPRRFGMEIGASFSLRNEFDFLTSASNRRHQQHFIAIFECVAGASEKTDVLFIHIDIEEAANLSGIIAQMRLERGELRIERREKLVQIGCRACDLRRPASVTAQGRRNLDCDVHNKLSS